jgi:hypothetical protein
MAALSLPCPFHDSCGGYIQLCPELNVEHTYELHHGQECVTNLSVSCELVAECSSCNFSEVVDSDRRFMTFDQYYNFNESGLPATPFEEHLMEEGGFEHAI